MVTEFLPLQSLGQTKGGPKALQNRFDPEDPKLASARQAAPKLEATFLAEMLKAAGFGEQENSFSGNPGEDQFASFHRQAIADKIAAAGGIGLSEHFLKSMLETKHD